MVGYYLTQACNADWVSERLIPCPETGERMAGGFSSIVDRMEGLRSIAAGVWAGLSYYGEGLYHELFSKQVFLWAQAIAFKALVTFVPIVILTTGLLGRMLEGEQAFRTVAPFLHGVLPESQTEETIKFLAEVRGANTTIISIGGVSLFLSAVSLTNTLRLVVGNAFGQKLHQWRSILGRYAFDARMVLQVGLLFFLTVGLSVVLSPFHEGVIQEVDGLLQQFGWGGQQVIRALLPLLFTVLMFFQLYYFVPRPRPRKRSAFVGATVAAVLWEVSKQGFTSYATYVGRFGHSMGGSDGFNAVGSTFGLLVALGVWVYLSGVLLVVGATVVVLRERRVASAPHRLGGALPAELVPSATEHPSPVHPPTGSVEADPSDVDPVGMVPPDGSPDLPEGTSRRLSSS